MFSRLQLLTQTLRHHSWAMTLTLVTAAVTAAIVTGALFVGDSVRGSLRQRVMERLGSVNHALVTAGYFRRQLAQDLHAALDEPSAQSVAVVIVDGAVSHAESEARAGGVKILGVPAAFWGFGESGAHAVAIDETASRSVFLSAEVARSIGARVGESVLIHFQKKDDVPAEHALGRRSGLVRPTRLEVRGILPASGLSLFEVENGQRPARNVFVPLETLSRVLGRESLANAILSSASSPLSRVQSTLGKVWQIEDLGLRLRVSEQHRYVALESRGLVLPSPLVGAGRSVARELRVKSGEVLSYLANTIAGGGKQIPYSIVAACESILGQAIESGTIVLNAWAAQNLGVQPGDLIQLRYYAVEAGQQLREAVAELKLSRIVPLEGEASDPGWTPEYPGISDASSLRAWDPPFEVDLDRVRDEDEEYWDQHKTTPKAFVSLADGKRLWGSRFGDVTAVRFEPEPGSSPADLALKLRQAFRSQLRPGDYGLGFRSVKEEGLSAAAGATDFGVLFVSFSFFIIVSALVLLAMIFRLGCERRARELGVLAAYGFDRRALTGQLLAEGAITGGIGAVVGGVLGLAYASLLVWGLRTWWQDAVNAPFLSVHTTLLSWVLGPAVTLVLALATLMLVARGAARTPPRILLGGTINMDANASTPRIQPSRWASSLVVVLGVLGLGLLILGSRGLIAEEGAFFGGGACLLGAALALFRVWLGKRRFKGLGGSWFQAVGGLGARALARSPLRALMTASLISSATFVIVAVAASRRDPGGLEPQKNSGNGGFSLVASAALPLHSPLDTAAGQEALAVNSATRELLDRARVFAFRVRPGDDASCLNLYRPSAPKLLGAPAEFVDRGGFRWAATSGELPEDRENPWRLLNTRFADGAIPAVGDANTVKWILHSGLGKDIVFADDAGVEVRLRLVGLLSHSLFQGELVVAENRLLERFPALAGRQWFLFEAGVDDVTLLERELESSLSTYGLDAETTSSRLASFQAVENTYLSTFQLLGGLGLLLGTLGLGIVLLRNVHERRGELGLLRAVGASPAILSTLILGETLVLLAAGLLAGAGSAAVAILPSAWSRQGSIPWLGLASTIVAIALAGVLASLLALRAARRTPILTALRRE